VEVHVPQPHRRLGISTRYIYHIGRMELSEVGGRIDGSSPRVRIRMRHTYSTTKKERLHLLGMQGHGMPLVDCWDGQGTGKQNGVGDRVRDNMTMNDPGTWPGN
jgi:hypothetical protein